jgi:hypothetical protein
MVGGCTMHCPWIFRPGYQTVLAFNLREYYPFGGKPPKAQQPLLWTDRPTTNDRPAGEELKYSHHRAWQHRHPTNNMFEV